MLQSISLTKAYQEGPPALDRLDLSVHAGEVFCLLGPNGAGKTTTVHLFLNFITPTSGQALVGGIDSAVTRSPRAASWPTSQKMSCSTGSSAAWKTWLISAP